jgi:hypothetical protein
MLLERGDNDRQAIACATKTSSELLFSIFVHEKARASVPNTTLLKQHVAGDGYLAAFLKRDTECVGRRPRGSRPIG